MIRSTRRCAATLIPLAQLGSTTTTGLTIIQLERTDGEAQPVGLRRLVADDRSRAADPFPDREVSRDEARMGGKHRPDLHPRALTRIHALSLGVPRGLEQLASLCLMGGAVRGLEVINPELVDAAAPECWAASFAASP